MNYATYTSLDEAWPDLSSKKNKGKSSGNPMPKVGENFGVQTPFKSMSETGDVYCREMGLCSTDGAVVANKNIREDFEGVTAKEYLDIIKSADDGMDFSSRDNAKRLVNLGDPLPNDPLRSMSNVKEYDDFDSYLSGSNLAKNSEPHISKAEDMAYNRGEAERRSRLQPRSMGRNPLPSAVTGIPAPDSHSGSSGWKEVALLIFVSALFILVASMILDIGKFVAMRRMFTDD